MRRIDARRGTENFKALFPTEFELLAKNQQGGPSGPPSSGRGLKVECLLTSAIWSYGHEAEVHIFLNLPFPSNHKENSSIRCILSTPEQNLLWHIIGCTPNTFHNTINKNVNHSNDTIDNLNQSSFHKPACQSQGHLRTESLSDSAHILHCGKIRPWVVRSGFRCASADLRQSRYLHVARYLMVQLSKSIYFILILLRNDKIVP